MSMANITRKTLESNINSLNSQGLKLNLNFNNGFYTLYNGDRILLDGTAKEIYIFLMGIIYGANLKIDAKEAESDEFLAVEYFQNKVGKQVQVEAKKVAENKYYSQFKNRYTINVERFKNNIINFTARVQLINPNGLVNSLYVNVPMQGVRVRPTDSIDTVVESMLKAIDMNVLKQAKERKNSSDFINSDFILWLTKDSMWYVGWNNPEMLTKSVSFKVL